MGNIFIEDVPVPQYFCTNCITPVCTLRMCKHKTGIHADHGTIILCKQMHNVVAVDARTSVHLMKGDVFFMLDTDPIPGVDSARVLDLHCRVCNMFLGWESRDICLIIKSALL